MNYLRIVYLLAVLCAAVGSLWYAHHAGYESATTEWRGKWAERDLAETQAKDAAVARQAKEKADAEERNKATDAALAAKDNDLAAARSDREHVKRLLALATAAASAGCAVPKAGNNAAAANASGAGSDKGIGRLLGLVTAARAECRRNSDRLDALASELKQQL